MKNIYTSLKDRFGKIGLLTCLIALAPVSGNAQVSYTFTPAGATGTAGPTAAQISTAYATTNLNGLVAVSGGIQSFTIPSTGPYRIMARGAQGGYSGGYGAQISGDFTLTAGTVLKILVGQAGTTGTNSPAYHAGGGGGGSFIASTANVPYVVAGGGGGNGDAYGPTPLPCCLSGMQGTTSINGNANPTNGGAAAGGINGNGGGCGTGGGTGGGGAGFTGNGSLCQSAGAALSFVNGGTGGLPFLSITGAGIVGAYGGFGGGGGQYDSGTGMRGGGGGGYSGGGGGDTPSFIEANGSAGGGGSYNSGTNQTNTVATTGGDGIVVLSLLCDVNLTSSGSNSLAPVICSGQSLTLTTNASAGTFTWSTGNTTSNTIAVTPSSSLTTYSVTGTSPSLGCSNTAVISITVSPGVPTLAVTSSTTQTCFGNTITLNSSGALTYTWTNPGVSNGATITPGNGVTVYTVSGTNGCGTSTAAITITVNALPISTVASSQLICSTTPVTLTASGAANYTWTPGNNTANPYITNPSANTTYTVLGVTGPCSGTNVITINTKPLPTLNISVNSSVVCAGQSANLTVTGNALTYTWNPGGQTGTSISVSPTVTTLYSVTGTNSVSCINTANQVLIAQANPTVTVTSSNPVVCANGSSTLTASGANSYAWSVGTTTSAVNVVNTMANTTYSVTGSYTNGCSGSAMVSVNVFVPNITMGADPSICVGASTVITASGADTYNWSNGGSGSGTTVSPTLTTVYTVTGSVTDPVSSVACPATNTIQVTVYSSPLVSASSDRNVICLGDAAVLTASGASTYTWTGGSGAVVASSNTVMPIANQTYSLAGTDVNGCKGGSSITIQVSPCVGIANVTAGSANLLIYPNPSNDDFTINADQDITLYIVNELGQQVRTVVLNKGSREVKVSSLPAGVYFVTGSNSNGSVNQKVIITK